MGLEKKDALRNSELKIIPVNLIHCKALSLMKSAIIIITYYCIIAYKQRKLYTVSSFKFNIIISYINPIKPKGGTMPPTINLFPTPRVCIRFPPNLVTFPKI